VDIVIVGAGFAGVATAYHLARRGVLATVVEREDAPGMHASGRNAGLLRQSSSDGPTAGALRSGARAARRILSRVPGSFKACGSLVLGPAVAKLQAGPQARLIDASGVVPGLAGRGLFDPEDGVIDPHALLSAYLDAARLRGARFRFGEAVLGVEARRGRVTGVVTSGGTLRADVVVNGAGAWAGELARACGSEGITMEPKRRHLFRGGLDRPECRDWPFVWNDAEGVYFRPEGEGLLLSPCDTEPHAPGAPEVDPARRDELADKLDRVFGALGEWRLGGGWACLRTFARDGRFVIGHDPRVPGLFWVAGLGGHGVTASWSVGRLAAEVLLGVRHDAGPFDPARLV